jgi:hypothetical protein
LTARSTAIVRYVRRGGRPPADDESLEIAGDGSFTARRTVGGARIGRFAGQLDATTIDGLRALVDALATAEDLTIATPRDGATEVIEAGGRTGRFGSNERPPKPWGALVDRLRTALDGTVLEAPLAAIELTATSRRARLRHLGAESLEVDLASLEVRAVRLDAEGAVLGRWQDRAGPEEIEDTVPADASDLADVVTTEPGWDHALPFDHPLELARGDWLQVWVTLGIRDDGERSARLFLAVPATSD